MTNYPLLLDNLGEAVFLLDTEGYVQYSNRTAQSIIGYTSEEILGKSLSLIYPSEDSIKYEFELSAALKKGFYSIEGWKVKKDGTQFWAIISISAIREPQLSAPLFSCTIQDISEKKAIELDLRKNEEHYRLMVEGVKDYAIFMLDPKGYILNWNEGARRTKGYSGEEIIGKHFSTFYTAEDLKTDKPARELVIALEEGKYEEEGWRVKKNGSVFWANIVITPLFNEVNKFIGYSKVTRDLSERKAKEEELRQSEERYRSLVEQVTDYGIFMMDEKGRIISWNEGAKRIKGYTAQEIVGKYFSIFYPEEDILNGKPSMELRVARNEGKYEEEGWRLRKDGSLFWANVVITAVYNTEGFLIGFSKVTRDLTERKAGERALRESYEQYRQLSADLKKANEELSYANAELEQFTSIVSHDLQEPIRTIKSFLQLIDLKLPPAAPAELKNYISKTLAAANRMKELIQNLLHYSQLSRGEMIRETVSVDELFSQAQQNLRTSIEASGAKIIIENEVETIVGDRVQLVQLVQNLLSNALKFTSTKNPEIKIKCTEKDGRVQFAITDNGIGIAKGDLFKVFEIFKRLNTEKTYPGTGIGLAICKKIVERHSGNIWPESEPGKGTTFYFTLENEPERLPSTA